MEEVLQEFRRSRPSKSSKRAGGSTTAMSNPPGGWTVGNGLLSTKVGVDHVVLLLRDGVEVQRRQPRHWWEGSCVLQEAGSTSTLGNAEAVCGARGGLELLRLEAAVLGAGGRAIKPSQYRG